MDHLITPALRPRILVISSCESLRERIVAVLSKAYDVVPLTGKLRDDVVKNISLAVIAESDRAAKTNPSVRCPAVVVRERFEPGGLLERVEMRLELERLRGSAVQDDGQMTPDYARESLKFLVAAAEGMANALSLDEALHSLCGSAVPRLAQWISITLHEEGKLVSLASWHHAPEKLPLLEELGRNYAPNNDRRHPIHRVISTGRSEFVARVPAAFDERLATSDQHMRLMRELGIVSFMCVPLRSRGKTIGALMLGADASWRPLSRADLVLAEQLGARAGSAIERARLHAALRRHEQEQALILDTVGAMIWFKDTSNRILRCNRAAAQWAGKTPEQIEGRMADEIFPAALARAYHQHDLAVIAAGCPKVGELEEIGVRGGATRWVQRDTIPYRDEQGAVVGVVIIAVDVTALKRAENLAAAKERAEREFIANVSHEFRTPVSAIKGFTQTLRSGAWKKAADRDRFFRIIESNADRLDSLVGDLITLSAIEGATPPRASAIELRPLTLACTKRIAAKARQKGVAVGLCVPRALRIAMDPDHLTQALEHLLDNAVKFTPPGGAVRIRARGLRKATKIWVEDSGIGIPQGELARVFERFFRVAKGAAPGNPGLGLHLVKKLVESYGGTVSVKSRLAVGSSFCLELPGLPSAKRCKPSLSTSALPVTAQ